MSGPTYSAHGWTVGRVPVQRWGAALDTVVHLPARWQGPGDGAGLLDPSDFELACFVHLARHEQARVHGQELVLLATECWPLCNVPPAADHAHARGESLVPYCPGIPWHWSSEMRGKPFAVA